MLLGKCYINIIGEDRKGERLNGTITQIALLNFSNCMGFFFQREGN
jgi:hypothetical protein